MKPSQTIIVPGDYTPPPIPAAAIYSGASQSPQPPPSPATDGEPADLQPEASVAAHLAVHRIGLEKARNLVRNLEAAVIGGCQLDGRGAACGAGDPDVARQSQTEFFTGTFQGPVKGDARPVIVSETSAATSSYGGIPGGVVLEGAANFSNVSSLVYDPNFNALTMDDTLVFFMATPPREVAALARSIAEDERIGVSLGEPYLVYGQLDRQSQTAINIELVDNFLADMVFAEKDWSRDYKFAGGYAPVSEELTKDLAVFFKLADFEFEVIDNQIRVSSSVFSARIVPLKDRSESGGNLLADEEAIQRGEIPAGPSANARHLADNIEYYRHERVIEQVFDYAAVAAVLRGLKAQGFDLHALANSIDGAWSQ